MKKLILLACAAFALNASAQTEQKALLESKSYDNWYIGINGGLATKTSHNKWLKNLNSNAGLRVGRWFTPAFGFEIESNAYFGDKPQLRAKLKAVNLDVDPEFIGVMKRIAGDMSEGTFVEGQRNAKPSQDDFRSLYPNTHMNR